MPSARSFVLALAACAASVASTAQELTLEMIMADTDWLGNPPQGAYWADDSKSVYYSQKRQGEGERDLYNVGIRGGEARVVSDEELSEAGAPGGVFTRNRSRKVFSRNGDLFLTQARGGRVRQLTRTAASESNPAFLEDENLISFRRGGDLFVRNVATGLEYQPADLRLEDDPDEEEESSDFLEEQQLRLFEHMRDREEEREAAKERDIERRLADSTRMSRPWYLGKNTEIRGTSLSPDGRWMLVRTVDSQKEKPGKSGSMPNYVTQSGYTTDRTLRPRVGTGKVATESLWLLDLASHERHELDLASLPGIDIDPLEEIREKTEAARASDKEEAGEEDSAEPKKEDEAKARPVSVRSIRWNSAGSRAIVEVASRDNKDRWIASVDPAEPRVAPLFHESDEAWINRRFSQSRWLKDGRRIWHLSEESGYAHLYLIDTRDGSGRALTSGAFEVSSPTLCKDGDHIYYRANKEHPGVYEIHRLAISTGKSTQLTRLGGNNSYTLSPDDTRLLITHSTTTKPPELYVQRTQARAQPRKLTNTVSGAFRGIAWVEPEIVAVPSGTGEPIYSRLYTPPDDSHQQGAPRPAVVFIHGAGYLQNAHQGWSSYSHEFMFHSLLVQEGYVVLDMDYRASAGYGRDWRTAIYRQMGTPEVEDMEDGVAWLAREHNVDPARVGCYGGSYGGFLTLMALFRSPDLFACGAALRPVTDWASYNHNYTSNILNIPAFDPDAYANSSPIEFAEGLTKPLLICHGMQDNNVFFADSVRLAQRLIELKKKDWELAVFPIEAHGFREPASWLDEYRRIFRLFETHLK